MTPSNDSILPLLAGLGIFAVFGFFLWINARSVENDYQINGMVNEVAFTEKGTAKIMIGGEIYFIKAPGNSFVNKIQVGDSVAKEKGSRIYKLFKKHSSEVVLSN